MGRGYRMKYRIIKKEGEKLPYRVQYRGVFRWKPMVHFVAFSSEDGWTDCAYRTQKDAEEALRKYLDRKKPPVVVKEIEV